MGQMGKVLIIGLGLLLILSGCSEKGGKNSSSAPQTGSVKGIVTVTQGSVEGIDVSIDSLSLATTTNASGAFELKGIAAGSYTLSIQAENGSSATREITVTAGQVLDVGTIAIGTGKIVVSSLLNPIYYSNSAVLQGSITTGSSITTMFKKMLTSSESYGSLYLVGDSVMSTLESGGISSLEAIPAPFGFKQVDIADDGTYRIENLPAGTNYQLVYIDGTNGANLGNITLKAGSATTQDVDSVAANIPAVTAWIKTLAGTVLEGATLKIHQTGQVLTADAAGLVTLRNLPAGSYTFTVSAPDYVSKVFSIDLTASMTSLETIELNDQKGGIAGKATLSGNDNHANIIVYAKAEDGSVFTALTDEAGDYLFTALPVGVGYSVIATANGLKSAKVDDITVASGITNTIASMSLSVLNTTREGDLGSIIGHARFADVSGLNHAGIIVSVEGTDFEAITSRDGSFILNNLAQASYTVNFTDSNHQTYTEVVEVVAGAATKLDDVTMQPKKIILTEIENLSLDLTEDFSEWILQIEINTQLTGDIVFTVTSSNPGLLTAEITEDRKLKLTSVNNQFGETLITVKAESNTITDIRKFNVVVNQVNDEPTIITTALSTNEDVPLTTTLQATDLESDTLVYSLVTNVSHGTLVLGSNGAITYTPSSNYFGSDSFTFKVTDEDNVSTTGTVILTVASVNDLPQFTAVADREEAGNQEITQAAPVTDPDSATLVFDAYFVSTPANASDTVLTLETVYHYVLTCQDTSVPPYEGYDNFDQATIDNFNQLIADATPVSGCNNTPFVSFVYDDPTPKVTFTPEWVGDYVIGISASDGDNNVTETFTVTVTEAWQDVGDGFFSSAPYGISDAIIDNNVTYAVYQDAGVTSQVVIMKYEAGSWSLMPDTGLDSWSKTSLQLAVVNDTLYLFCQSHRSGTTGNYYSDLYRYDGGQWELVSGASVMSDYTADNQNTHMVVDGHDIYVYVSYDYGPNNGTKTGVYKLENDAWTLVTTTPYDQSGAIYSSAYVTVTQGTIYLMPPAGSSSFDLYKYNAGSWDLVGGSTYTEDLAITVNRLLGIAGKPYVFYSKADVNDSYYSHPYGVVYTGSSWETLGGSTLSDTKQIHYGAQVFELDDTPYVFTYEDRPTYRNVLRRYVNGSWELVGPMWGNGSTIRLFNNYDKPFFIFSDTNASSEDQPRFKQYADLTPTLQTAAPSKKSLIYPSQWMTFAFDTELESTMALNSNLFIKDGTHTSVGGTVTVNGRVMEFIPYSPFNIGENYRVGMTGITGFDASVSPFDVNYTFGIKTTEPLFATGWPSVDAYDDGYYHRGVDHNYTVIDVDGVNNRYILKDNVTGLMWDDNHSIQKNWADAITYCEAYDYGGYSDWRLPTMHELYSLVDVNTSMPSTTPLLTNIVSGIYWTVSRTPYFNASVYSNNRTIVVFNGGYVDNDTKTDSNYVRCVRGTMSDEVFSRDESKAIVIDHRRGLMWQDDSGVNTPDMNWSEAIDYCETLSLGSYSDWTLPNVYELTSIINPENNGLSTDFDDPNGLVDAFVNDRNYHYWTSTNTQDSNDTAWLVDPGQGATNSIYGDKNLTNYYVRCVRKIP